MRDLDLRSAVIRGFRANLFWGLVYSGFSGLTSYLLIRIFPTEDFAAYVSATSAASIGVVLVEGGLTLGFTRYLARAIEEGTALSLYEFVLKRRLSMGLVGCGLLIGWSLLGLGHHALLDGHIGRWVWVCIALMFLGELVSLLPFAGLQALFAYQYSLATRAIFVAIRGALVLSVWFWLRSLYAVLVVHGSCVIFEGLAYHWRLRRKLVGKGEVSPDLRQQVLEYGYFSFAEKGAHAVGGINGIFLILGYLVPASVLAPVAVAKELAQRIFSLGILPVNNLTNGVLNLSTDSPDLSKIASRSLTIMSVYVVLVAGLALGVMNFVLPALKLATDDFTMSCTVLLFAGVTTEYVLRYDQSYRFRLGQMWQAVAWAYASAVAAVGLTIWWAPQGIAVALVAYYVGRLSILAMAVSYKLSVRYESALLFWLPATLAGYGLTMATLLYNLHGYWHWVPLVGILGIAVGFYRSNRTWLGLSRMTHRQHAA